MTSLLEELQTRIVPADGAMGTMLMAAGIPVGRCFEELCVSEPALIEKVHRDYLDAGAEVIETNTFGANAARLEKHGLSERVAELNRTAADLARRVVGEKAWVLGSVGPLGWSAEQLRERKLSARDLFREQIAALLEGNVDGLLLETFLDLGEIGDALAVATEMTDLPVVASIACSPEGRLPSGSTIDEAFATLRQNGASVVGANCVNGPQAMVRLFRHVPVEGLMSAFPNAGYPKYHEGRYIYGSTPDYFAEAARALVAEGARLIGGCCGIGPKEIAAMVNAIRDLPPVTRKTIREVETPAPAPAVSEPEKSILDMMAAGHTVIVTELDPPKTLDLDKFLNGAQALRDAGTDLVTLADNSLAILRVSNLAMGAMLKERFDVPPLLHVSCRDRNLIGLQSELMGMAALGIRHILPLTGDPAKVGDHPGASSVYDVSSIDLIKLIVQMNTGLNYIGKSIKLPTQFIIGCTFNPGAKNLDAQISRLERKVAAGAQYVMTQPVFNPALIATMAERTKHIGVPILTGVWPLLNGRQAEFLHNEVPGISIPDDIRASMSGLEGADGRRRGLEIAKEVCRAVLDTFPGVYLITPFLNYETTVELTQFVRSR